MASAKRSSVARRSDGRCKREACCSWLVCSGEGSVSIRRFPFPVWKTVCSSPLAQRRGRYQPVTHSIECRLCAALHAELAQDMADVGLDGLFTKSEVVSDLFV